MKFDSNARNVCEICLRAFRKDDKVYDCGMRLVTDDEQKFDYTLGIYHPPMENISYTPSKEYIVIAHMSCFDSKIGSSLENAKQLATDLPYQDCQKLYEYIHYVLKHKL